MSEIVAKKSEEEEGEKGKGKKKTAASFAQLAGLQAETKKEEKEKEENAVARTFQKRKSDLFDEELMREVRSIEQGARERYEQAVKMEKEALMKGETRREKRKKKEDMEKKDRFK